MVNVQFTQFLLPDGRQRPITIELEEEMAPQVNAIVAAGCRFTAEILQTGQVSFCIEEPVYGDFDMVICANGPGIKEAIILLVVRFSPRAFARWKSEQKRLNTVFDQVERDDA